MGGIQENSSCPSEFSYENLMIQNNVIHQSYLHGVKKTIYIGNTCAYPKNATQPIKEERILTGPLEPTSEPYAVAKIVELKLCESYNRQIRYYFSNASSNELVWENTTISIMKIAMSFLCIYIVTR